VGLIGPLTNRSGNEQQIEAVYDTYGEFLAFVRRFGTHGGGALEDLPTLAMFCTAMRRNLYERVGALDERFGIGMFEDDDYAMRVRAAGHRVVCTPDAFVHHFGQASLGKLAPTGELGKLFHGNRRRFERKWGVSWETHRRRPNPEYERQVARTRALVCDAVPEGASVLVLTGGDADLLALPGRLASHFPRQDDGTYAGHYPADGRQAIADVDRWRRAGFGYLVVPATSAWWLDHYEALREHLRISAKVVATEEGTCVVYALDDGWPAGEPGAEEKVGTDA
jgi:hypothetical protein